MDLQLGGRRFGPDDRVVMAIVNRTPDSFYDRGRTFALDDALAAVDAAVADGAEVVDIGGVKAGAGPEVGPAEEAARVVDLVAATRERHPGLVISVDTWRSPVGAAVAAVGADLLNDAWGGADPDLARVAGEHGLGLVCMHVGQARPRTAPHRVAYPDVMADVLARIDVLVQRALDAGVAADRLVVDPGHDFGKNTYHSLEVTRRLGELVATGRPVLVSLSRKDFIGETVDRPPEGRLAGTLAATALCAQAGARMFRAHDVAATVDALRVADAVAGRRPPRLARRGLA
jgi:dihydropteroate synthase